MNADDWRMSLPNLVVSSTNLREDIILLRNWNQIVHCLVKLFVFFLSCIIFHIYHILVNKDDYIKSGYDFAPAEKNGPVIFVESSITRRCIARICWNLLGWVSADSKLIKSTSGEIHDGGRSPNWTYLNRNNAAADCCILLKCDTLVRYESAEVESNCWICRMVRCEHCN